MPHSTDHRRATGWALALASVLGVLVFAACQEPAGPPPTLEPGSVSFTFTGASSGSLNVDGRCYWSDGYPVADSSCALALDLGDTIRIRAVREPRTLRWVHMNLDFPPDGACPGTGECRFGWDYLNAGGAVEQSFRSIEATVTVLEETEGRMRGTFSGLALQEGSPDTVQINDGTFDVPVER